jgi:gamma-glutamyltranspeptidase
MVSAAHPLATEAGVEILAKGGSAIDAAVAVQMVLNLVEPQSSGIGGGSFMLHYDSKRNVTIAYDGREIAPQAATSTMFLGDDGKPIRFADAVRSGKSFGIPGTLRSLGVAESLRTFGNTLAVRRDDTETEEFLNVAMDEVVQNGAVDRILKKYENMPNAFLRVARPFSE